MEVAAVSVARGAMGSLLTKLGELLTAKYKLLKEAKGQVMFLKAELESMHAFLKKISDMEDPDEQDKCWAKEVRELSYDIEDSVTEFMPRVERKSGSKPHGFKGFISRSMNLLTAMNTRHEIAKEFEGLKRHVKEVSERRARYKIDDTAKPNDHTAVDLRILALHAETASLVGVTGPRDDLIKLMDEQDVPAQQLKVLSIVGFGGLGKTTLANEIYRKIEGQFQCRAVVSVSQKPNIRKIIRTVLSKVGFVPPENTNMELWEESELISTLHKFLLDKRYFIVVDDIWDAPTWNIIRCGLPENMNGSRVITTTRIETVARACCINNQCEYVYKIKRLSEQDSRRLFFKRIFGSEDACPPHLEEVSTRILKRCGGLPLAIITISSLLASQPNKLKQQWEYVQNSLGSNFEVNPSLDGMRQILNLSYINLPHHLKACMLYLGIYPEDHTIDRNGLLRQWIAEGFIGKHHGIDSEDIARSYFNELVNRNMIQPVDTDNTGEVMYCKVHDMMLDLMQHISREENFITVIDDDIQDLTRQLGKIRRLSLNLDGTIDDVVAAESIQLSHTRMLARFGTSAYIPPLSLFKHLRVLTIEISDGPLLDLNGICHLFLLRYIKIKAGGRGVVLPSKICHLQQLEAFELDAEINSSNGQSLQELPSDVVHLSRLLHLIVQQIVKFPVGIGNIKSLRTLQFFDLTIISEDVIKGLGELTNLIDLRIQCDRMRSDKVILERGMEVLRTCLEKLSNLKYLGMSFHLDDRFVYLDPLSQIPASFYHLERFYGHVFSNVPGWIGKLRSLHDLALGINEVLEDDIGVLAQLPSLIHLWLHICGTPKNTILIRRSGFPVLESFTVGCNRMPCLALEVGAMSKLERLGLHFNATGWDKYGGVPAGMEHLSSLKEISVKIGGDVARESNRRAAESAVWKAVDLHPGRPVGRVNFVPYIYSFYDTDGNLDNEFDVDGGSSTRSST
ncbi:hypothetical protein U9M48_037630 [Paspalum notatum var. saurae]|uniref:Uncharacterized protein n=1 Tax=Paspalum notatum var. saurae TaxID=547442 RepID=A0AAQ3UJQ5_PASNO